MALDLEINVPSKAVFFRMAHNAQQAPINNYRVHTSLSETDLCPRCNQQAEMIMHMLKDCPKSQRIMGSLPSRHKVQRTFLSSPVGLDDHQH